MVRRPAPGRVVEPRPAEARIPDPVPGRVGRPARRHAGRHPDAAVALDAPPASVLVERLGTVDARGNVLGARGLDQVVGALVVPAVPRAERRGGSRLHARRRAARDHHLLVRGHRRGGAARRRHGGAAAPMRAERGRVRRDLRVVVAGALHRERAAGRVELDRVPRLELAQVHRGVAGGDAELHEVRLLVVEADLGAVGGAHECARSHLDLHVAGRARVEDVARGQRRVERGGGPVLRSRPPEGDVAVEVADAGRRGLRRLFRLTLRRRRRGRLSRGRGGRGRARGRGRCRGGGGCRRGRRRWCGAPRPDGGDADQENREDEQSRADPSCRRHRMIIVTDGVRGPREDMLGMM